jgi:hypothetical protein
MPAQLLLPSYSIGIVVGSYLVGKGQAQLDLFAELEQQSGLEVGYDGAACLVGDGLSIASALQGSPDGGWANSESCTGNAEGVHGEMGGQLTGMRYGSSKVVVNKNCFDSQFR